jgi:hypothetical protein
MLTSVSCENPMGESKLDHVWTTGRRRLMSPSLYAPRPSRL